MSCTARQPGLVELTTSDVDSAGTAGSSLTTRRCSCTWPVTGSRSMSVSLCSIDYLLIGFQLRDMKLGYEEERPGPHRHPGAWGRVLRRSREPEGHARQDLVHVDVLRGSRAQLVLPGDGVAGAPGAVRRIGGRAALVPRADVRGFE